MPELNFAADQNPQKTWRDMKLSKLLKIIDIIGRLCLGRI